MHWCNHKFTLEACGLDFCHDTEPLDVFSPSSGLSRFGMGEGLQGLMNQVLTTNHDRRLSLLTKHLLLHNHIARTWYKP